MAFEQRVQRSPTYLQAAAAPNQKMAHSVTQCNRGLKDPDVGVVLGDAFSTGRQWSPWRFNSLPKKLQKAWQDMRHSGCYFFSRSVVPVPWAL